MDRQVFDLGTARNEEVQAIDSWSFLYIGDCDGDVTIKFGKSLSPLNPEEFDKLTDVDKYKFMYVTNTAQADKKMVIYFEEKKRLSIWT